MSIQRIKLLVWLVALALGAYLVWFVADFLRHKADYEKFVPVEEQTRVLNDVATPEPPKEGVVKYDLVREGWFTMNWTGKAPPKVIEEPKDDGPKTTPHKPVADLLKVVYLQVDTVHNGDSVATRDSLIHVRFVDGQLKQTVKNPDDRVLRVGDTLPKPHDYATLTRVTVDGAHFSFDDEAREGELVPLVEPKESSISIVAVGENGPILPDREGFPDTGRTYRPERMISIGRNNFVIGTEDVKDFENRYTEILSTDVRYRSHRDSKTGKIDGLEITSVKAGSIAAAAGLTKGEVVKAINGTAVTSTSGAISYVKQNADTTKTWVVLFEKQGKEYTRTYQSPPD